MDASGFSVMVSCPRAALLFLFALAAAKLQRQRVVGQHQRRAQQHAAEDVGQPVHAGKQTAHGHHGDQHREDDVDGGAQAAAVNPLTELHHGAAEDGHRQKGVRRRERGLQLAVLQHRTAVHHEFLKQHVARAHDDVEARQQIETAVHGLQAVSAHELRKSQRGEGQHEQEVRLAHQIRQPVERVAGSQLLMHKAVDYRSNPDILLNSNHSIFSL